MKKRKCPKHSRMDKNKPTGKSPRPSRAAAARPIACWRANTPSSFDDLIGQEAMVKTLSNAFELGRIHQAYMLTGVRGVGKTTTAQILARAFNYELPAQGGKPAVTEPTIHMPELGVHCQAIINSRHVDVIEMERRPHRHRRCARDHRGDPLSPRARPHQGLYHRRSAYALETGLQRFVEDARRAAGTCEIRFRDDRDRKSAGHRALALPALRSAPHRGRCARRASRFHLRKGKSRDR